MTSFLFLIPALMAAATLAGTAVGTPQEMEVDAGREIDIPCNLKGVRLVWYWIPLYPICAGMKTVPEEIFFVISSSKSHNGKVERFQKPSSLTLQESNGNFTLTVQFHHMNDSGTFYCSNDKKTSPNILVVVKSEGRSGMIVETSKNSHRGKQRVALICKPCEDKSGAQTDKNTTIVWTLNGKKASDHVFKSLRNKVIFEKSPQNYGLWKCSHPTCPTQYDGYCLENEFRTSEKPELGEGSWPNPATTDATKRFNIQIIGGSVIGLLSLLWIGAVIFALWEKLRSRRISKTAKEPKSQGTKNSVGVEKPPEKQGKEKDMEMDEGAEGIQYSVLQFKELERYQSEKDKGTPTVVYAEMLANNCSGS